MKKQIYIGAAYYPEQWPKERWAIDADLMKEAGINIVRMAEFGWSLIEPEDGIFDFSLFDEAIEILYKRGIEVVMGTPTMTPPLWMWKRYPDIVIKDADGLYKGRRSHYCSNNPDYQRFVKRIVRKLAEHYKDNPAVVAWQIDNEFNAPRCYCRNCSNEFRNWLREKYGTLDNLNEAWGNVFWSQIYTEWGQVEVPHNGEMITNNPSKILDYYRFISDSVVKFQKMQADILREVAPHQKLTHNGMGLFDKVDYHELGKDLDFYSWDTYPAVDADPADICIGHDLSRGVKQKGFWVMEQKNGYFNYSPYNLAIEPGLVRLWSYRDIARGADGVVYFRWRSGRYGSEQHPQGLLRHDGSKRRAFYEVQQLTNEIKNISADLAGSKFITDVAMLWNYDQIWALSTHVQNSNFDYKSYFKDYYKALLKVGINPDIINPLSDLSGYRIVIAPTLFVLNDEIADNLMAYARNGGTLVLTIRTGIRTWSNITTDLPWPGLLHDAAGITVTEFDSLPSYMHNSISYKGRSYNVKTWLDILSCDTAEPLAVYEEKFYKGQPAITVNEYGKGKVIYVGVMGEEELYSNLLKDLAEECGVKTHSWPNGIEVTYRQSDKSIYMFVLNGSFEPQKVQFNNKYKDLITGKIIEGEIQMEPLGVLILTE